jgi:subtilisin family serine protease
MAAGTRPDNPDYQPPPRLALLGNLRRIRWQEARNAPGFQEANEVSVAVLDSGFDPNHEDLIGQFESYHWQYQGAMCPTSDQDPKGHGTHVAGIIGASNTNNAGVKGICRCRLMPFKIFRDSPTYVETTERFEYVVEPELYYIALASCAEANVQVVNLSIAGDKEDIDEIRHIGNLISGGAVVVAAMGNGGTNQPAYPAAIPGVVAVGALSDQDTIEPYSNRGNHILLCAPGKNIWSTHPTYPGQDYFDRESGKSPPQLGPREPRMTHYERQQGTSMAAAHVSGAVALLLAKWPHLTVTDVRRKLWDSAVMLPEMNNQPTDAHGSGRLDLERLLT